jgi:hypothetical protein
MALNHREMMCVYFGYCASAEMSEEMKSEALKLTAQMLGMKQEDFITLQTEALDGMKKINDVMVDMLAKFKEGKNPFNKGGENEKWR